jgi:hypothetical protein
MICRGPTIFSVSGLLLTLALWGASYLNIFYRSGWQDTFRLGRGSIIWLRSSPGQRQSWRGVKPIANVTNPSPRVDGFDGLKTNWRFSRTWHFGGVVRTVLPLWIPSSVFAVCSAGSLFFSHRRRRQRIKSVLCIRCGYNLHGLPEPRCPECGTPFEMTNKSEAVSSKAEASEQDATP